MLDELWLHSHRVASQAMQSARTEVNDEWLSDFEFEQRVVGERLCRRVLREALGSDLYRYCRSDASFGHVGPSLRHRLPLTLAFGHELALAGAEIATVPKLYAQSAARACALLNCGVALFDLLVDSDDRWREQTIANMSRDTVRDLAVGIAQDTDAGGLDPEVLVVLRIVQAFFACVSPHLKSLGSSPVSRRLETDLLQAHQSELAAVSWMHEPEAAVQTSRSKSVLPFLLMADVLDVYGECARKSDGVQTKPLGALMEVVGTLFWRIDDLTDAAEDFSSDSVNSILASDVTSSDLVDGRYAPEVLARLLSSSAIAMAGQEAADAMSWIAANAVREPAPWSRMRDTALGYALLWQR